MTRRSIRTHVAVVLTTALALALPPTVGGVAIAEEVTPPTLDFVQPPTALTFDEPQTLVFDAVDASGAPVADLPLTVTVANYFNDDRNRVFQVTTDDSGQASVTTRAYRTTTMVSIETSNPDVDGYAHAYRLFKIVPRLSVEILLPKPWVKVAEVTIVPAWPAYHLPIQYRRDGRWVEMRQLRPRQNKARALLPCGVRVFRAVSRANDDRVRVVHRFRSFTRCG